MVEDDVLRAAARNLNSGAIHVLRGLRGVDRLSGLPPARLSALSVLVFGGPRALGELAAAEGVAGPTMTRVVDGLVAAGLAVRRAHPRDRRAVLVEATDAGDRLLREAAERRLDALVAALRDLPDGDREALLAGAAALPALAAHLRARPAEEP